MLPDRVWNLGPLTYESGALPIALRGPASRTVSNKKLGGGGLKRVLLDPNPRPQLLQLFKTFGPHKGFLTHQ